MTPRGHVSLYRKAERFVSSRSMDMRVAWARSKASRSGRKSAKLATFGGGPWPAGMSARRERTTAVPWSIIALRFGLVVAAVGIGGWFGSEALLGGLVLLALVFLSGVTNPKPWHCGNCKRPLATSMVRVCPGCGARLTA